MIPSTTAALLHNRRHPAACKLTHALVDMLDAFLSDQERQAARAYCRAYDIAHLGGMMRDTAHQMIRAGIWQQPINLPKERGIYDQPLYPHLPGREAGHVD